MMKDPTAIYWFRQDLRLSDNPALCAAAREGKILLIYILDDENAGKYRMGGASRFWLHYSLQALDKALGGALSLYRGDPLTILQRLCQRYPIKKVFWNRCYEPWRIARDITVKEKLLQQGLKVLSHNGSLLWEPWAIKKNDGSPYKVFTPFYRKGCLGASPPREPLSVPEKIEGLKDLEDSLELNDLGLLPRVHWDEPMRPLWNIGEEGAHKCFSNFLKEGIANYKEGRNFPAQTYVSKLSPHLHFGEISPNQAFYGAKSAGNSSDIDHFCSELGWREFSYTQLYFNPDLPEKNLQKKFDAFPWKMNKEHLEAWQKGSTGVPFVDAGMRELWQTGYMHNRVRMVVGSFLVKNLLIHWHHGERWFWDCLVDADLANNSASWQWIAGCGADAAPYFRIFNPVTQGQKFDSEGEYTRKYVPELKNLPDKYLFNPWEAPESILKGAGVELGKTYPYPIVDIKKSREEALDAFQSLKDQ